MRGAAENLIKRHKSQLASDRTSCRSPLANQMRLILHTAAYWLMLQVRHAIPRPQPLSPGRSRCPPAAAAGQRGVLHHPAAVAEDRSADQGNRHRISLAFASNCPDAALFHGLLGALSLRPK
jgi:Transposase DDE domain group 1